MERFLTRHASRITGILSGFDRMLLRGTLRSISDVDGLDKFLSSQRVVYKDFASYVERLSDRLKTDAIARAAEAGRPYEYLASAKAKKEDRAREIQNRDRVTEGLVCVLSCVEPCHSFTIRRDRDAKRLRLVRGERKCLHLYCYFLDADFGLMHVRLQTWLPFTIQVCVNGREWLARQLTKADVTFTQVDNCFTAIADVPRAQTLADDLIDWPWERWLRRLGYLVNPWVRSEGPRFHDYYWSVRQREYATDVMFPDAAAVHAIYPALLRHGIEMFSQRGPCCGSSGTDAASALPARSTVTCSDGSKACGLNIGCTRTRSRCTTSLRSSLSTEGGEAPGWQGAKSEHIGNIRTMSNVASRDASPAECQRTSETRH